MPTLMHSLETATIATFEELGFLFADPVPSDVQRAAPVTRGAWVAFDGPVRGRVELRVAPTLVPVVAANMLGADQPPSVELQQDALGELANVVCGNVVQAVGGADALFRLAPPAPLAALADDTGFVERARVEIGIDDGRVEAVLLLAEG